MKKLLISVLCIVLLLSFSGCASKEKDYDSEITAFSYHFGSGEGVSWKYDIEPISGVQTLTVTNFSGVEVAAERPVTAAQLTALNKIITDNQIYKWNKFNKSERNIMDGNSFSLSVTYANGKSIIASGYMKYPKNYDAGHAALAAYLADLAAI
ncbi:MAG: hypothetical protein LBS74_08830 [Oscillospiraceae bacterium]|jgi:hypothetical protein|nr:hypothetical protein [Oscillospiraceae bacterium]